MKHIETDHLGITKIETDPKWQSWQTQAINSLLETSSQHT